MTVILLVRGSGIFSYLMKSQFDVLNDVGYIGYLRNVRYCRYLFEILQISPTMKWSCDFSCICIRKLPARRLCQQKVTWVNVMKSCNTFVRYRISATFFTRHFLGAIHLRRLAKIRIFRPPPSSVWV